jgi:hypothetical protein
MIETKTKVAGSLKLWQGPLPLLLIDSLRQAIWHMHGDSRASLLGFSEKGFVDHAWEQISACAMGMGELWLYVEDSKVRGFLVAGKNLDVDHQPTYVIRLAWVDKALRRTPKVKEMLVTILSHAKMNFFKHVLIVSSRHPRAYLRWLGSGWMSYTTVLKGEL